MTYLRMAALGFGAWILATTFSHLLQRMLLTDSEGGRAWFLAAYVGIFLVGMSLMPREEP